MDTLSRDSSSSSNNLLPFIAIALGAIGIVVGALGIAKANKVEKAQVEINNRITEVDAKIDSSVANLRQGVEQVLGRVSAEMTAIQAQIAEIGTLKAQIAKLEEAQKARAAAPVAAKGAAAVATGTVDANGNYTVAPGDSIYKIAKKFATKPDSIEAENPGLDPTKLRAGQKIKIPRK